MSDLGTGEQVFSVTSEQHGHTAHLRMSGELDLATAPVANGSLHAAESNGNTAIVVDLEQLTFMDASGLRAFLGASQRAGRSGRTFAIVKAPACVQRVLQITGTTHLLAAPRRLPFDRNEPLARLRLVVGVGKGSKLPGAI